jgi:hypothetical protein
MGRPLRVMSEDCRPRARAARAKLPPPREAGMAVAMEEGVGVRRIAEEGVHLTGGGPKQRPGGWGWLESIVHSFMGLWDSWEGVT